MVVLIDRSADRAERVVAVREDVGDRKLRKSAGSGGLDYADIGYVMRGERVELDFKLIFVALVVRGEDRIRDGILFCLLT